MNLRKITHLLFMTYAAAHLAACEKPAAPAANTNKYDAAVINAMEDEKREKRRLDAARVAAEDSWAACVRFVVVAELSRPVQHLASRAVSECAEKYDAVTDLIASNGVADEVGRAEFRRHRGGDAERLAAATKEVEGQRRALEAAATAPPTPNTGAAPSYPAPERMPMVPPEPKGQSI